MADPHPLPDATATRAVHFALLMPWGRVGSHVVLSGFEATHGIRTENEPTTLIRTQGDAAGLPPDAIWRQQLDHLDKFTAETRGMRAGGLKLAYRSLVERRSYLKRLAALDYRLVVLVRENFLKCAVSQLRALDRARGRVGRSGDWISPWAVRIEETKPGPSDIDVREAIRVAGVFRACHEAMLADVEEIFGADCLRIEYDDLRQAPQQTVREVFAYLGLEVPRTVPLRHRKATSDDLREDVLNYDALAAAATKAGLGRFL